MSSRENKWISVEKEVLFNYMKRNVKINAISVDAVINAVFVSDTGIQFRCRYFWNGDVKETYFYAYELTFLEIE